MILCKICDPGSYIYGGHILTVYIISHHVSHNTTYCFTSFYISSTYTYERHMKYERVIERTLAYVITDELWKEW